MIYKYISSKNIISKVKRDFNLDYTDWIYLSPEWIGECISQLEIKIALTMAMSEITVSNYRCNIPCDLEVLLGIEYNGYRLNRNNYISRLNKDVDDTSDIIYDSLYEDNEIIRNRFRGTTLSNIESYSVVGNNVLDFTFEEGDIIIYYKTLPLELDSTFNIYLPLVPDNANLIECISWYIISKILGRGYLHPVFTYKDALQMFEKYSSKAKSSLMRLDPDEKERHSKIWQSLTNVNYHNAAKFR